MTAIRRPISEIMYREDELDVALLQPPLFKPIFPEDQDPVFNRYLGVVTGHTALMNDLGTEPNHGLLQLAAVLQRAGARTDANLAAGRPHACKRSRTRSEFCSRSGPWSS